MLLTIISYTDIYFQIGLIGDVICSNWKVSLLSYYIFYSLFATYYLQGFLTDKKIEDINKAVVAELNASCAECGITNDIIDKQSFACFPESPTYVTYRAGLEGTSETDSGFLISLIEEWVSGGSSIVVAGVLMIVDSECSVAIPSLTEGGCSPATVSTMVTNGGTVTSTAIIGGVVAAILLIAIIIAVVIVVVLIIKNHRKVSINKKSR